MTTIIATKDMVLSDGKVTVGNRVDQLNFCKVRNIGNYLLGGQVSPAKVSSWYWSLDEEESNGDILYWKPVE